jgi:hypothetical protein
VHLCICFTAERGEDLPETWHKILRRLWPGACYFGHHRLHQNHPQRGTAQEDIPRRVCFAPGSGSVVEPYANAVRPTDAIIDTAVRHTGANACQDRRRCIEHIVDSAIELDVVVPAI